MRKAILLFLIITATHFAGKTQNLRSDTITISHFNINLDIIYLSQKTISGNTILNIKSKQNNVSIINLDLLKLNVDSIFVGSQKITQWSYNDTLLSIPLLTTLNTGDSIVAQIYYHGQPVVDPSGWGGFYFSNDSTYAFNLGVGFFDNPHNYGRVYYPCIDDFHDRATYDFNIRVKDDKVAVCNGSLENVSTDSISGTKRYQWKLHSTIPSYLSSVAVGPYVAVEDTFQGMNGAIPIAIYVPSTKVAAAQGTFSRLKQILAAYEWAYGPYRWERVGYVGVPFSSGAMEHATNIALGLGYINGNHSYESLYAHELSHHWFGDLVTCNSAPEMWLNEGWAVFSESMYREILDGKEVYKNQMRHLLKTVIQNAHNDDNGYWSLNNVPHDYTYGTTVYDKGATVAHSIRGYLGDSLFFPMLRAYFAQNAFSHMSNTGFRDFISTQTGVNMNGFFNAWIFEPGFVHFSIDSFSVVTSATPESQVTVYLKQKLHHKPNFANDNRVKVAFFDDNWQRHDEVVTFSGEHGSGIFTVPFTPSFVVVDPEEQLADATVDYLTTIKTSGLKYFNDSYFRLDVKQITDSALLRISHSWVAPDTLGSNLIGLHISSRRYWTVKGIFPPSFDATGRFYYSKFSGLDDDIISSPLDSLVILWRRQAGDPWHKVDFSRIGSWSTGYFYVDHLKQGEYAVASWESQYAGIKDKKSKDKDFEVSPNPTSGQINIRIDGLYDWKIIIFDNSGRKVDEIQGGDNQTIKYVLKPELDSGIYYFTLYDSYGNTLDIRKVALIK